MQMHIVFVFGVEDTSVQQLSEKLHATNLFRDQGSKWIPHKLNIVNRFVCLATVNMRQRSTNTREMHSIGIFPRVRSKKLSHSFLSHTHAINMIRITFASHAFPQYCVEFELWTPQSDTVRKMTHCLITCFTPCYT